MNDKTPNITLSQRYSCAWAEINSRILARQTIYTQFYIASITTVSILFIFIKSDNHISQFLSIATIFLSWIFVLMIKNEDCVIGLLSTFCKTLEKMDNNQIPSWHDDSQEWIIEARIYRQYTDFAGIIIIILNTLPSGKFFYYNLKINNIACMLFFLVFTILGLLATIFLYKNKQHRINISKYQFKNDKLEKIKSQKA